MANRPKRSCLSATVCAVFFGCAAAVAMTVVEVNSINKSTSSTAAIGCLFIPLIALPAGILGAIWGIALYGVVRAFAVKPKPLLVVLSAFIVLGIPASAAYYVVHGLRLVHAVSEVRRMDADQLDAAFATSAWSRNKFYLGALAENRKAGADLLDRIASLPDAELYERMWSRWDVMGENGKGLAVMRLVALHDNVTAATLEKLASSPMAGEYVLNSVLANPKTPAPILERYRHTHNYLIKQGLAHNPNTPRDILERLAADPSEYTSGPAKRNLRR